MKVNNASQCIENAKRDLDAIRDKLGDIRDMEDFACGTGGFLTSWLKELEKEVKTTEDRAAFGQSIYGIEKKQFP